MIFSVLAGRRGGGVCVSADSAGEADALINIGAEHAPSRCARIFFPRTLRFSPVSALAAAEALAGGHAEPAGRCNSLYAGITL